MMRTTKLTSRTYFHTFCTHTNVILDPHYRHHKPCLLRLFETSTWVNATNETSPLPSTFPRTHTMLLKLYGVPLSQPFRSVAWTMLQLEIPFEIVLTVPGMSSSKGSKHENFTALTPHQSTQVPLLSISSSNSNSNSDDDDKKQSFSQKSSPSTSVINLTESPAILAFLCDNNFSIKDQSITSETLSPYKLYAAPGSTERAQIDSYLHWHHTNTRFLSRLFQREVRPDLGKGELSEKEQSRINRLLETLDSGWLQGSSASSSSTYIAGMEYPTIADILAYGELSTVTMTNLLDIRQYNQLEAWMERMTHLPFHDEAHTALHVLRDMKNNDIDGAPVPLAKRLSSATKAGLQAFANAQEKYTNVPTLPHAKL